MNAGEIKRQIWASFDNFDYKLFNVYVFGSESDFLGISKSGYVWEVEIKISRSDFKNDFNKTITNGTNKHEYLTSDKTFKPNRFCFAVPEGLITPDEVPKYAGLLYVTKTGVQTVKMPKFLHKDMLLKNHVFLYRMMNKFYYRHSDLRRELDLREYELKYRQRRIEFNRCLL